MRTGHNLLLAEAYSVRQTNVSSPQMKSDRFSLVIILVLLLLLKDGGWWITGWMSGW